MSERRHPQALPDGYQLGGYRLLSQLGAGGFGITYLAEASGLKRRVVVKELLPTFLVTRVGENVVTLADDEAQWEWAKGRFVEEAQALARCDHPNVLQVYDVFASNGTVYTIAKYEEGCTLESWLRKIDRVPTESELTAILQPLLSALRLIHQNGILHRDIKPDNIYLTREGRPVLIDFGSSRAVLEERTTPITAILTPGYAPFEQYTGSANQGPWTDFYSLGAVLYRAITGTKPPESFQRLRADPCLVLAIAYLGRFTRALLGSIDSALAVEAKMRPQSADEWLDRIRDLAPGKIEGLRLDSPGTDVPSAKTHPLDEPSQLTTPTGPPLGNTIMLFPDQTVLREAPVETRPTTSRTAGAEEYARAIAAVMEGDVSTAIATLARAAEAHHAGGREQCARIEQQMELTGSTTVTLAFLRRILGESIYRRAREFARGVDVPQDHGKALDLYEEAAELGDATAHFALGQLHALGKGVRRSAATALGHYRHAAEEGHAEAMYHLGIVYEKGLGVPVDLDRAKTWLEKALKLDYAPASDRLHLLGVAKPKPPVESPRVALHQIRPLEPAEPPPPPIQSQDAELSRTHDLFFSYCRHDAERIDPILRELQQQGVDVWWDRSGLDAGDFFELKIGRKIANSRVFAVAISREAVSSDWVLREVQYAKARRKPIFPLYLETVSDLENLDFAISGIHAVDLIDPNNFSEGMTKLLTSLRRIRTK